MSGSRRYLLDANVFMEAKDRYYGFALCPGFWDSLILHHSTDRVCSIDRVRGELLRDTKGPDGEPGALSKWAKDTAPKTFFKKTQEEAVIEAYGRMVYWVESNPQFQPSAQAEFASVADGWLVAFAKVQGVVLVTHEVLAPESKRTVPIPNVCQEFGVEYVNTFRMLEELRVEFILNRTPKRAE